MICHVQIVDAGKNEQTRTRGLREPPSVTEEVVVAPLHAASDEIQNGRADLNCGIDARRVREGAHQRVALHGTPGDCLTRRIRLHSNRAVLH